MNIKTEQDIDGATAYWLRRRAGLQQRQFWQSVGMTQSTGCRCENGAPISKPVRTLIYAQYVAGLTIDATTERGAAELVRLASIQRPNTYQD